MHITFVSSYVPRKCGIANYSKDLLLELEKQGHGVAVVAVENIAIPTSYSYPVTQIINQDTLEDYINAAKILNESSTDIVHLQHEFGLFGGDGGDYILSFVKQLKKPLIVTMHTVLVEPGDHRKKIIQQLAKSSTKVIVMEQIAKDRLMSVYGLSSESIVVIRHGVPVITMNKKKAKKMIGLSNKYILFANNLLSRNKGMEYAIDAISAIKDTIPHVVFLFIGETHPVVKIQEGESYRNELLQRIKKAGLQKQIKFKNKFLSLEDLTTYLAAADIYITPYLDPQQVTSGTLSYAIGAGKACIATEYIYAKDLLGNGKGILVPFRDSNAIAAAVIDLYFHPKKQHDIERKTKALRKTMQWPNVAKKHAAQYEINLGVEQVPSKPSYSSDIQYLPLSASTSSE